jgi:hypothetical protein
MLRRISLIAASAAMVAVSTLSAVSVMPASAATTQPASTTHKRTFPSMYGLTSWGTYKKTSKGLYLVVCAKDTARANFASGAVAVAYNSNYSKSVNLGAVAFGHGHTVCRWGTLTYSSHLRTWSLIGRSNGTIKKSGYKNIF